MKAYAFFPSVVQNLRPLKGGHKHLWEVYKTWASASLLPSNCRPPSPQAIPRTLTSSQFSEYDPWLADSGYLSIQWSMCVVTSGQAGFQTRAPAPKSSLLASPTDMWMRPSWALQPSPATSGTHTAWSQKSRLAKPARAPDPQHHETRITVLSC